MSSVSTHPSLASRPLADVEASAWRGIQCVHGLLAKELDGELERAHGLSLSSYEALEALACSSCAGRMRMCDLAERTRLSRSGLTRLVDRLERNGLISRACCDSDARGSFAVLTETGERVLADASSTYVEVVRTRLLDRFSEAELAQLGALWERVIAEAAQECGAAAAGPASAAVPARAQTAVAS
jgi:DNA-binding MarR family transcriptional regulator